MITVTAAAAGVKNAQASVLHSLYGVGTDITVTKAPTAGSGGPQSFGFGFRTGTTTQPAAGTKIDTESLRSTSGTTGTATPGGARSFGGGGGYGGASGGGFTGGFQHVAASAATVTEHLTAPVTIGAVLAAVLLAVLGGLIAGSFGGWRAARLRPADALSKVA